MRESQLDFALPPRPANEILEEQLSDLRRDLERASDPMQRVIIEGRIGSISRILHGGEAGRVST